MCTFVHINVVTHALTSSRMLIARRCSIIRIWPTATRINASQFLCDRQQRPRRAVQQHDKKKKKRNQRMQIGTAVFSVVLQLVVDLLVLRSMCPFTKLLCAAKLPVRPKGQIQQRKQQLHKRTVSIGNTFHRQVGRLCGVVVVLVVL